MLTLTTAPPAEAPPPSIDVNGLIANIQSFVAGVLSLDPEQAALRGGLAGAAGIVAFHVHACLTAINQ